MRGVSYSADAIACGGVHGRRELATQTCGEFATETVRLVCICNLRRPGEAHYPGGLVKLTTPEGW